MPSVLSSLAPALMQTFLTILIGYVFGRLRLLPAEGLRAMGLFLTMLSLPALLLRNMITLDWSTVEWDFFLGILGAKCVLFVAAIGITVARQGWRNKRGWSDAGVFAIFATQSNDFAMGLPILTAMFHDPATAHYSSLLYVIAPISLALLNPIGFFLMELGREAPPTEMETAGQAAQSTTQQQRIDSSQPAHTAATSSTSSSLNLQSSDLPLPPSRSVSPAPSHGDDESRRSRHNGDGGQYGSNGSNARGHGHGHGHGGGAFALRTASAPVMRSSMLYASDSEDDAEEEGDADSDEESEEEEDGEGGRGSRRRRRLHVSASRVSIAPDGVVFSVHRSSSKRKTTATPAPPMRSPSPRAMRPLGIRDDTVAASASSADRLPYTPPAPTGSPVVTSAASTASSFPLPNGGSTGSAVGPGAPAAGGGVMAPPPLPPSPSAPSPLRLLLRVVWKVLTNPVVLCTLLGIGLNFALGRKVPTLVDSFLLSLGNTFSSLALFVLGAGMVGKMSAFRDASKLTTPLLLIAAKSLALPIVGRLVLGALGVSGTNPLSLCAFIVCSFPTAPSVPFFALDGGAPSAGMVGPAMVLGTMVAAPIMLVSAQMSTVALTIGQMDGIVGDSTRIAAGFGFIGAVGGGVTILYNGQRFKEFRVRSHLLLALCAAQASYALGLQFCHRDLPLGALADARFWWVMGSQFAVYELVALIGLNEMIRRKYGARAEQRAGKWYAAGLLGLTCVILGGLQLFGSHPTPLADIPFCACWFRYGQSQQSIILTVLALCISVVITSLLTGWREATRDGSAGARPPMQASPSSSSSGNSPDSTPRSAHTSIQSGGGGGGGGNDSIGAGGRPSRPRSDSDSGAALVLSIASGVNERRDGPLTNVARRDFSFSSNTAEGESSFMTSASQALSPRPSSQPSAAAEHDRFWTSAVRVFLLLMSMSMLMTMALYAWSRDRNGTRLEMQLLDAVMFASSGVYTLLLFAAPKTIKSPLKPVGKWIKKTIRRCCF